MWHELVGNVEALFSGLVEIDERSAQVVREAGCACGGRLHRADYPRKPRGLPVSWESAFGRRISFCCDREGCRRRHTPPSVRFLGRRVYVGALVLAVSAAWVRASQVGVAKQTARRWRRYFRNFLVNLALWPVLQARVVPPVDESELPGSLLLRFAGGSGRRLMSTLEFLSPTTTESSPMVRAG